jgi:transcriptional regulator with XRE-family HTH domain
MVVFHGPLARILRRMNEATVPREAPLHGFPAERVARSGRRFRANEVELVAAHADSERLGERLRELREARRLTQQEVATRAGLSRAFLSQVERNQVSPSVASVSRIAQALDLSLADLFARTDSNEGVVRAGKRVVVSYPGYRDQLVSPSLDGRLLVLVSEFEPGASSGDEPYSHEADEECVYVLDGILEITVEGRTHRLAAGDAATFSSRRGHGWRNPGPAPATAMWVMTPPKY